MALTHSSAAKGAATDAVTLLINAGGAGTLEIGDGNPLTPAIGTVLAILTFSADAFGDPVVGLATANAITADTSADATGTASVFRVKSGAGTVILYGSVGGTGSGEDIELDDTSIVTGQTVSISSATYITIGT